MAPLVLALAAGACAGHGAPPSPAPAPADSAAQAAVAVERALGGASAVAGTLAVPPLSVVSPDTVLDALGFGLADLLTTDLARSGRLTLVERERMDAVERELGLGQTGRVDSATAPRVGRLLGARRLVVGSVVDRGTGELVLDVRVVGTADGVVTQALSARAPLNDILLAEKEVALRLFDALGVTLTPGERELVTQRQTTDLGALLAYSQGVRDDVIGDFSAASAHFQDASRRDPGFAAARAQLQRVRTLATGGVRMRRGGAARVAASATATNAIDASPIGTMNGMTDATMGAMMTMMNGMMMTGMSGQAAQSQGNTGDRAAMSQSQAAFTTVVVHVQHGGGE